MIALRNSIGCFAGVIQSMEVARVSCLRRCCANDKLKLTISLSKNAEDHVCKEPGSTRGRSSGTKFAVYHLISFRIGLPPLAPV